MPLSDSEFELVEFHVNLSKPPAVSLVAGPSDNRSPVIRTFAHKDRFVARVFLYQQESDGSLTNKELPEDGGVTIGVIKTSPLDAATALWAHDTFTVGGDEGARYYEATVSLNTDAMGAIFGTQPSTPIRVSIFASNDLNTEGALLRLISMFNTRAFPAGDGTTTESDSEIEDGGAP